MTDKEIAKLSQELENFKLPNRLKAMANFKTDDDAGVDLGEIYKKIYPQIGTRNPSSVEYDPDDMAKLVGDSAHAEADEERDQIMELTALFKNVDLGDGKHLSYLC